MRLTDTEIQSTTPLLDNDKASNCDLLRIVLRKTRFVKLHHTKNISRRLHGRSGDRILGSVGVLGKRKEVTLREDVLLYWIRVSCEGRNNVRIDEDLRSQSFKDMILCLEDSTPSSPRSMCMKNHRR
jgi:hypothetical protein